MRFVCRRVSFSERDMTSSRKKDYHNEEDSEFHSKIFTGERFFQVEIFKIASARAMQKKNVTNFPTHRRSRYFILISVSKGH